MFTLEDRFALQAKAMQALSKIRENKEIEMQENKPKDCKFDYSTLVFKEFSDDAFLEKMKVDNIFYNTLVRKLDEEYSENLNNIVSMLIDNVKSIYEHLNIEPRTYHLKMETVLTESEEVLNQKALRLISEFINKRYYSLTQEDREKKYYDRVKSVATELMESSEVEVNQAIEFATKSIVIKDLVESISFPGVIKDKIQESLSSQEYAEFFDQESLINDWNTFNQNSHLFAKLVGTVI